MARTKIWPDGRRALEEVKENGKQRRVPSVNPAVQEMIRRDTVHVFNVGPWAYRENMGSFGFFFIPACEVGAPMEWEKLPTRPQSDSGKYVPDVWEEGRLHVTDPHKEYAAMRPLPGLMVEPMPKDQDSCELNMQDDGRYFANQILGVGIGRAAQTSLVRRGCFVAEGKEPTTKELNAARAELQAFMEERIREADLAWSQGPMAAELVIRPETHHLCAQWLNLTDRDWLRGTKPQGRIKCMGCGALVDIGVATCPAGHIVDADAWKEFVIQQESIKKALGA